MSAACTDVLGLLLVCCASLEKLFSPLIFSNRVVLLSGRISVVILSVSVSIIL